MVCVFVYIIVLLVGSTAQIEMGIGLERKAPDTKRSSVTAKPYPLFIIYVTYGMVWRT